MARWWHALHFPSRKTQRRKPVAFMQFWVPVQGVFGGILYGIFMCSLELDLAWEALVLFANWAPFLLAKDSVAKLSETKNFGVFFPSSSFFFFKQESGGLRWFGVVNMLEQASLVAGCCLHSGLPSTINCLLCGAYAHPYLIGKPLSRQKGETICALQINCTFHNFCLL